jgi:hypothetical protein
MADILSKIFLLIFFCGLICDVHAQEDGTVHTTVLFPNNPAPWKIDYAAGASLTILPLHIVENEVRQLPLVDFRMRMGLPSKFALNVSLNAVYVTNQLSVGLSWTKSFPHFSFGLQNKTGLWIGAMDFSGYDTYGLGITNTPGLSLGANIDDMYFTLQSEMLMQIYQKTIFGADAVRRFRPEIVGAAFTFSVEQDILTGHRLLWGMRMQYARPQYEIWLAFYDVNIRLLTPQFFVAYIF